MDETVGPDGDAPWWSDLDAAAVDVVLPRVARLAARAFGVPAALAAVGDAARVWRFAAAGIDGPHAEAWATACLRVARDGAVVAAAEVASVASRDDGPWSASAVAHRFVAVAAARPGSGPGVGVVAVFDREARAAPDAEAAAALVDLAALAAGGLERAQLDRARVVAELEVGRASGYDPLTGALDRRGLLDRFEGAVALARRTGVPLAVLALDLGGMARGGHGAGERDEATWIEAVQRLRSAVREHDLVARLGDDAFVVVLQAIDAEAALEVAERIAAELRSLAAVGGRDAAGPSVGIASFPGAGEDAPELLRAADAARGVALDAGGVAVAGTGTVKAPSA